MDSRKTRSSSGISRVKKRDPMNVADPPVQVQKSTARKGKKRGVTSSAQKMMTASQAPGQYDQEYEGTCSDAEPNVVTTQRRGLARARAMAAPISLPQDRYSQTNGLRQSSHHKISQKQCRDPTPEEAHGLREPSVCHLTTQKQRRTPIHKKGDENIEADSPELSSDDFGSETSRATEDGNFLCLSDLPTDTRMRGYEPQPSSKLRTPAKQSIPIPPGQKPQVLVLNSSDGSMDPLCSPGSGSLPSFGTSDGDPEIQSEPSVVKLENAQCARSRAITRKELKKDGPKNAVFEEIRVDFYLLAITKDLFIENSANFKPTIRRLASDAFLRLGIPPFDIQEDFIATFARDLKAWRHKLKKHLLVLVPLFYGIGIGIDRRVCQENIALALKNGNFAFRSYEVSPRSGALEHPAIEAVLHYTFGLRELRPSQPSTRHDLKTQIQQISVKTIAYALTMIKYVLNQYKGGVIVETQQEFSFSDYSHEWHRIFEQFCQWRSKPERADDWNRISRGLGSLGIGRLGLSDSPDAFTLLDTD